jgi:hypothetical protein
MDTVLLRKVQRYIAIASITSSALRNQGAAGVIEVARTYLGLLPLRPFATKDPSAFARQLDRSTETLRSRFPAQARGWGTARKAINLFLRDAVYNAYLRREYHLQVAEPHLEIPLDSFVVGELRELAPRNTLPTWKGVKHLTSLDSAPYQAFAAKYASHEGISRIHLDLELWVRGRPSAAV